MIKITKEVIKKCAKSIMFELKDEEVDAIYNEFNTVLLQVSFLNSIEGIDKAKPMTYPYNEHQKTLREDIPTTPIKTKDALKNSNTILGNQIKLPKVIGSNNEVE